jgi:hypothetical protein
MPRRRPFSSLPLTRAENKFLAALHARTKFVLDEFEKGNPGPMNEEREFARELIARYRARRYGHQIGVKRSTETRLKIAAGAKITSSTKPRDSRGRFAR